MATRKNTKPVPVVVAVVNRPPDQARLPLGVYMSHTRDSAIAIRHTTQGVWYLTMIRGWIEVTHVGEEKFLHDFPLKLPNYPTLRALKMYESSGLRRDETTQKVMQRLLERLR